MKKKSIKIAKEFGFEQAIDRDEIEGFRKDAPDGSYWFAFANPDESDDDPSHKDHVWNIGRFKESDTGGEPAEIVVIECLPLAVVLQEHESLPAPAFDNRGNGFQEEEDTFTELAFRDHKGKASWDRMVQTLRSVPYLQPVFDEGFEVTDTGGNCLVFVKYDDETNSNWMIATEDTVFGHPARMDWSATRNVYAEKTSYTFGIENGTLADSLARYRDLPVPSAELEERYHYIEGWDDLDDVLAEISSVSVNP
jgi:hypothetical protein